MRNVLSGAAGQISLPNGRVIDRNQQPVAPPSLSATSLSRRGFLAAGACALSVLGPQMTWAQAPVWREFRRDDVGFRVEMPGAPRLRVQKGDPADNWITSTDAQVRFYNEFFDLSWTEFKNTVAVEDEYTRFRDMMTNAGYRIEEDVPLTLQDVPAREFIIETGNINFVRRIMAMRNFAISIHAMGARNVNYSPTARRFIDSFGLLRK